MFCFENLYLSQNYILANFTMMSFMIGLVSLSKLLQLLLLLQYMLIVIKLLLALPDLHRFYRLFRSVYINYFLNYSFHFPLISF